MSKRLQIARECLRQIWQKFDAGGHSIGRSEESVLLEAAMEMIDSDSSFSALADRDPRQFHALIRDELHRLRKRKQKIRDKELGLENPS